LHTEDEIITCGNNCEQSIESKLAPGELRTARQELALLLGVMELKNGHHR